MKELTTEVKQYSPYTIAWTWGPGLATDVRGDYVRYLRFMRPSIAIKAGVLATIGTEK